MRRNDWCQPLRDTSRSADESIAHVLESARALAAMAERWRPEAVTVADIGAADALLPGLLHALGELRRTARAARTVGGHHDG